MSLSQFVKIAHISNLSDARYCAGMMVDILGFEIADPQSEHFVDPDSFEEITSWVTGVSFAGECHGASANQIREVLPQYPVQYVETDRLEVLAELAGQLTVNLIYKARYTHRTNPQRFSEELTDADRYSAIIIVEAEEDPDKQIMDNLLAPLSLQARLIRAYALDSDTVTELPRYWDGIELQAEIEEQAGLKDYGIVMDILEQIEED